MNAQNLIVRTTVACPDCKSKNELTIADVFDEHVVLCSACGAHLGTVADLRAMGNANEVVTTRPATFAIR